MKIVLGLLVVVGLGWVVILYTGGYMGFDPTEQGRRAKAALAPGMTMKQVFDITGEPRKYRIINRKVSKEGGVEIEVFKPSAPVDFDRARVGQHIVDGTLPDGFNCTFSYSNQEAFTVTFDATGTVLGIDNAVTMADLLQTRE